MTEDEQTILREYKRTLRLAFPEQYRASLLAYRQKHRAKISAQARARYRLNPPTKEQKRARNAEFRRKNPESLRAYERKRHLRDRASRIQLMREWYRKNKARARAYMANYYAKHREQIAATSKDWRIRYKPRKRAAHKARYASDPAYRMGVLLRGRLRSAVVSGKKSAPYSRLLGCSLEDLRIYLESKFEPGMTWENHGRGPGKWHVDHIMPCAIFDLAKPEHQKRCFHFSNLQPMWEPDNLRKGAKILTNQFRLI